MIETPRTDEVLRKNADSEQTVREDYDILARHAIGLERELTAAQRISADRFQEIVALKRELSTLRSGIAALWEENEALRDVAYKMSESFAAQLQSAIDEARKP